MILFEASWIYGVEDNALYVRTGNVVPDRDNIQTIHDAYRPIIAYGVQPGDFSLFTSLADAERAAQIPYLVTAYGADGSTIVPSDVVEADPRRYATLELARKLQSVEPDEIEQFGLQALLNQLHRRYPDRRK